MVLTTNMAWFSYWNMHFLTCRLGTDCNTASIWSLAFILLWITLPAEGDRSIGNKVCFRYIKPFLTSDFKTLFIIWLIVLKRLLFRNTRKKFLSRVILCSPIYGLQVNYPCTWYEGVSNKCMSQYFKTDPVVGEGIPDFLVTLGNNNCSPEPPYWFTCTCLCIHGSSKASSRPHWSVSFFIGNISSITHGVHKYKLTTSYCKECCNNIARNNTILQGKQ